MALWSTLLGLLFHVCLQLKPALAADLVVSYEFVVSAITASPLGVPQQVIAINNQFPGPPINVTTNNIVSVNVHNKLEESLLLTWSGIQMRGNCWQDGVIGTNCPIPPNWNWTYNFQVKDQIGSYFYFPSIHFQRASGGFGAIIVNNRDVISVPFLEPAADIILLIGDWYIQNHTALRNRLDNGKPLGMPDGVLINGKGPCRYNNTLVPDGIDCTKITLDAGKTYRLRVHHVGIWTSLNFRIGNHSLLLVETEGSYTSQQNYSSLDIHVGQSYSFLLTLDQKATSDYYIVASPRFVNETTWAKVNGIARLCYSECKENSEITVPDPPQDQYDKTWSMNQARSIRWNVTSSGARPNPQGSYRYGGINVTDMYVLRNLHPVEINGKQLAVINGMSFLEPETPIRLVDQYNVQGVYKLGFPNSSYSGHPQRKTSVINGTYKGFMEIILQNNDTKVQSYHMDGYAFFMVGMDYGEWTENSRGTYNKWDGVARCTTQVFPGAWTAILVSLDNVGVWNLRAENLDSWYLGQQLYVRVVDPESNATEIPMPNNTLLCGALGKLQKPQKVDSAAPVGSGLQSFFSLLLLICSVIFFLY